MGIFIGEGIFFPGEFVFFFSSFLWHLPLLSAFGCLFSSGFFFFFRFIFSASILFLCFSACSLFCFLASLLFCFSAFLLLCFSSFFASSASSSFMLLSFSASLLLCFSASLLLCFFASLLFRFFSASPFFLRFSFLFAFLLRLCFVACLLSFLCFSSLGLSVALIQEQLSNFKTSWRFQNGPCHCQEPANKPGALTPPKSGNSLVNLMVHASAAWPPSYSTATTEGSVCEKDAAKKFGGRAEGNYKPPHNSSIWWLVKGSECRSGDFLFFGRLNHGNQLLII